MPSLDKSTHPHAFPDSGGITAFYRRTEPFSKVYNAITGVPSDAPSAYAINRCNKWTVKVYSNGGDITCLVQVCADPEINDWFTVATLNNASPYYSSVNMFSHVRMNVTAVTGTAYVWLLRNYIGDK